LGRGPTVGSPWSSSTLPSLGRGRVAPLPPGTIRCSRLSAGRYATADVLCASPFKCQSIIF